VLLSWNVTDSSETASNCPRIQCTPRPCVWRSGALARRRRRCQYATGQS
jgi:hypothetical protein